MKPTQRLIIGLSSLIAALALVAAATGVVTSLFWQGSGHYDFTTLRGQTVQIWGTGLYRFDSVPGASQEIAQDLVTLFVGIPVLVTGIWLASRGSLRGKVLLTGTLGYIFYTYTSMTMLTAYNELFLVYVALMSLCLFAFILSLTSIEIASLPAHFSASFPRRTIAGFDIFLGVMLASLWLKLVASSLLAGTPPDGLDSYTTLVIQAMDLALVAPSAIVAGVLLLRREALGYLLSSVVLVVGATMGAALLAMIAGQVMAGVPVDPSGAVMFAVLIIVDGALFNQMLRSLTNGPTLPQKPYGQVPAQLGEAGQR